VYWDRNIPKFTPEITQFVVSDRQEQLSHPKQLHREYEGDRPSPIWPVSRNAQRAKATTRLESLAVSKSTHKDYLPDKQIQTIVSDSAKQAVCSDRLMSLAHHKTYPQSEDLSKWDWSEWQSQIPERAKTAEPSERTIHLAQEKRPHSQWRPSKKVQWDVSRAALSYEPSENLAKLALPRERGQNEDYNGKAWVVSRAALQAQASPRIQELCIPLPRKVRAPKKTQS
jgi:hypothetical protein